MYSQRNILDMLNGGYETKSYTVVDSDDFVIVITDDPNEAYGAADEDAGDRVYEETTTLTIAGDTLFADVDLVELSGFSFSEWTTDAFDASSSYSTLSTDDWLEKLLREGPSIK